VVYRLFSTLFLILGLLVGASPIAWAGGALKTNINGVPLKWGNNITWNAEQGAIKPGVIDHAASVQMVQDAFNQWDNIQGLSLNIAQGPDLPDGGDTNLGNYKTFHNTDVTGCYDSDPGTPCYIPIIFDTDGSIVEDIFGECKQFSILGVAGFVDIAGSSGDPALTELKKGWAVFSGACVEPVVTKPGCEPCVKTMSESELRGLILHELGHFLALGHNQVNPDSYNTCLNSGNCPAELVEHIPTMFPMMVNGSNQNTLHADDMVAMQRLYGGTDNGCEVSGKIFASDGSTELRGVEVVARNNNGSEDFTDAIAYVSGEEAPKITQGDKTAGNCGENCGNYALKGLRDGQTYQVCVQRVLDKFVGSRFVPPVDPPFQGVDQACPEGLTFTCDCPGGNCQKFTGVDIVTTNEGLDLSESPLGDFAGPSGGCSLIKPRISLKIWQPMVMSMSRQMRLASN